MPGLYGRVLTAGLVVLVMAAPSARAAGSRHGRPQYPATARRFLGVMRIDRQKRRWRSVHERRFGGLACVRGRLMPSRQGK